VAARGQLTGREALLIRAFVGQMQRKYFAKKLLHAVRQVALGELD
jgi:hypothetical protein